jgi:hypothetical protein
MLPASYQQDVETLVHEWAAEGDEELWNKSFGLVRKVTRLLEEKREMILGHPMLAAQVKDRQSTEQGFKALVGVLQAIGESELADLDELRRLDVKAFLEGTGAKIMGRLAEASSLSGKNEWAAGMAGLRDTEARVVQRAGDAATVEIERPGTAVTRDAWVRVEGKWIPQRLADVWPAQIAQARAQLAKFSGRAEAQAKQQAIMQLTVVEGVIDGLLAARTTEEFNAGVGAAIGMVIGAAMSSPGTPGGFPALPMPSSAPSHSSASAPLEPGVHDVAPPAEPVAEDTHAMPAALLAPEPGEPEVWSSWEPADLDATVRPGQVERYVGESLVVVRRDGREIVGRLVQAESDRLVLEREVRGGTVSFEVPRREIEEMRLFH